MGDFYRETLLTLLRAGVVSREQKIFVACGGWRDREVLQELGFTHVVISNLFPAAPTDLQPFQWSYQDAENLTYADDEFDFCIVHDGLHHCGSPHRALLELYRVGKHGLLAFEPPDSWLTRAAIKLGLAQEYELAAVVGHAYRGGGWRNTVIPNFVHRWTRREIRYAIQSHAPFVRHDFIFRSGVRFNLAGKLRSKSKLVVGLGNAIQAFMGLGCRVFPSLGNLFAFAVIKPDPAQSLHPWLAPTADGIALNPAWFQRCGFPDSEKARTAVYQPKSQSEPAKKS